MVSINTLLLIYNKSLGAFAMTNAYTEGTWYVHIKDLNCTGNESSIFDCPMNGIPGYSCYHHDDASVICQCECLMWPSAIFRIYKHQ